MNKKIKYILLILLIIFITLSIVFFSKNKHNNSKKNEKVLYDEYIYSIPEGFSYRIFEDNGREMIDISNEEKKISAFIVTQDKNFFDYDIFKEYNKLENTLKDLENTFDKTDIRTYKNHNVLTFETHHESGVSLLTYTEAADDKLYIISLISEDKTPNYDNLYSIIDILMAAKKNN